MQVESRKAPAFCFSNERMLTSPPRRFRTGLPRLDWNKLLRPARASTAGTAELGPRQVYILPTRAGLFYAVLLACMLIGSINYGLSLGHALTFLLAGLGMVAMLHTWRNLAGLELQAARGAPVFAGAPAQFRLILRNRRREARHAITVTADGAAPLQADLSAASDAALDLQLPTRRRGWLALPRCTVASEFPLGLFRAWAYVELPARCLVYPSPAAPGMPWPAAPGDQGDGSRGNGEDGDFSGLREHRAGESLRGVDWKASARSEFLLSKQFEGSAGGPLWLDWQVTPGRDNEARIAQLTRWVLDAQAAGLHFGLRLPGQEIAPDAGSRHVHACLRALALHGLSP